MSNEGEDRLQGTKKDVEKLQEETALALKKNVYKNYSQFIETAKEISSKSVCPFKVSSTPFFSVLG